MSQGFAGSDTKSSASFEREVESRLALGIPALEQKFESLLKRAGIQADVGISGQTIAVGLDEMSDVQKVKSLLSQTGGVYEVQGVHEDDGFVWVMVRVRPKRAKMKEGA
jgi:hypothetical protein